ncbi:MAG: YjbH domain-containing protein, partial [Synergistaceae bacterium]|nr:YjbH domain-containing protein [Synergistaceae bacterium]
MIAAVLVLLCGACEAGAMETAANPGFTGLWEYPTAEMPGDGAGWFGYTNASPYAFYYVDLAWLPWLEVNARLTTFDNVYVTSNNNINVEGRGRDYMDKALDLKAMIYRSRERYLPSLAFGVTDVMGTELMKAWYGVATWRLDRWAFSVGYGTDRLNGLFGGVSWSAADWLTLKAEYSPLDYTQDAAGGQRPHPDAADEKYNLGVVLKAPWGTAGALSWQRGEELVFSVSQRFDLKSASFFEGGARDAYGAPGAARVAQWRDVVPEKLGQNIMEALAQHVRVRDIEVGISDRKVFVAYENYGHASHAEAMVRVLVVTAALSPHLESIFLIPRVRGVPVVCAEFPGELLFGIRTRDLETKDPLQAARFTWAEKDFFEAREAAGKTGEGEGKSEKWLFRGQALQSRAQHDVKAMIVYEPRIDQTLDDDYQSRWSVDFIYENRSFKGWGAVADLRVPFFNDVDIWWEPDMNDDVRLQQAVVSYLANLAGPKNAGLWVLGEAGWLDENWFGLNLWGRAYTQDGRWWGGTRLGVVRDRDPRSFAGLARGEVAYGASLDFGDSPWRSVAWLQGGYSLSEMGLDLQVDYGRFADTDVGGKLSAIRRWDDAAVGFWISRTDRLTPGKDFTNAGVSLELPAERWFGTWLGRPSAHVWDQSFFLLSTWRIDAGREPGAWRTPERMLSQLRPIELKKNVEKLLQEYCSFESDEKPEPPGQKSLA